MYVVPEDEDSTCYSKARAKGESTFTIRAQDVTAPETIAEWIKLNIHTAPPEKLHDALDDAIKMRQWTNRRRAD